VVVVSVQDLVVGHLGEGALDGLFFRFFVVADGGVLGLEFLDELEGLGLDFECGERFAGGVVFEEGCDEGHGQDGDDVLDCVHEVVGVLFVYFGVLSL